MPLSPSTWITNNPITAHQLNQDLYTYDGSYFAANGVMFHSNRPLLIETCTTAQSFSLTKGGRFTVLGGGTVSSGISVLDNAALYGTGSDAPGDAARFQSNGAVAPGSSGIPGQTGGWNLVASFVSMGPFSSTSSAFGNAWFLAGSALQDVGALQPGSTTYDNIGFAVDLLDRVQGASATLQVAAYMASSAGTVNTIKVNTVSTVGETPRLTELWCGVNNGNGNLVTSIPSPLTVITETTPLSSAALNSTIQQTLNLLNYPPMLSLVSPNVSQSGFPSSGINANSLTTMSWGFTPNIDNYSKLDPTQTFWTVPLSGLYFCHCTTVLNPGNPTGQFATGIQVNSSQYWGGWYNYGSLGGQYYGASVTKILDLRQGDTLSTFVQSTAVEAFSGQNPYDCHLALVWMGAISSGTQPWTPPEVTGFQFRAASPPAASLNVNPFFAAGSGLNWSTVGNGSFSVTGSPPAGAPYQYAGQYVNNGLGAGAAAGGLFITEPAQQYVVTAWVYASAGPVQIGLDWLDINANVLATGTQNVVVPVNTWVQIQTTQLAPNASVRAYPRVGAPTGNSATIYIQAVQATISLPNLAPLMHAKIANDVNFLLNRPYLMARQTTAQTGLTVNTFVPVTMNTVSGMVHGSNGDNYAGWSSANNWYAAPVNGWYLAVSEISSATIASGCQLTAGLSVPTSGGVTSPTSSHGQPDWYQSTPVASGGTQPSGATAIGCYYLNAGETISPAAQMHSGTATSWSTDVSHGFNSHFEVIWLSN